MVLKTLKKNPILVIIFVIGFVLFTYSKKNTPLIEGWSESCKNRINRTKHMAYRNCGLEYRSCRRDASRIRGSRRERNNAFRNCSLNARDCFRSINNLSKEVTDECKVEETDLRNQHTESIEEAWERHRLKLVGE
tara:strand:- start:332 stop:736 length:405 start_codon:yes stop_codon:yes gene_type:complete